MKRGWRQTNIKTWHNWEEGWDGVGNSWGSSEKGLSLKFRVIHNHSYKAKYIIYSSVLSDHIYAEVSCTKQLEIICHNTKHTESVIVWRNKYTERPKGYWPVFQNRISEESLVDQVLFSSSAGLSISLSGSTSGSGLTTLFGCSMRTSPNSYSCWKRPLYDWRPSVETQHKMTLRNSVCEKVSDFILHILLKKA